MTRLAIVSVSVVLCVTTLGARPRIPGQGASTGTAAPQPPPRDTSAPSPPGGVGTIVGRVTSAATGTGVRGAVVTAYPVGGGDRVPMSARVGEEGRYRIEGVPAGIYGLYARHPEYLLQGLGQTTPRTPERRVLMTAGLVAGPMDFPLLRGAAISGRVLDELGAPVERIRVRASKLRRFASEWRLMDAGETTETDDRGEYRLFGLAPGEYVIGADPVRQVSLVAADGEQARGFVTTWAPSTLTPADAQRVRLEPGGEGHADVQLVFAPVGSIAGRVVNSSGQPVTAGSVRLRARGAITGIEAGQTWLGGDGSFRLPSVPPGRYTLVVEPIVATTTASDRQGTPVTEVGIADVDVASDPLSDLVVRTDPGASLRGRLIIDGDAALLAGRSVFVVASLIDPHTPVRGVERARVRDDLSFELRGIRGPVLLRIAGVPDGWWTRAVRIAGADGTDGVDPGGAASVDRVELVVSTRPTGVRGRVMRATGALADAVVLLFTRDERRWQQSMTAAGIMLVRPDEDGTFRTATVRPGPYYAIALDATEVKSDDLGDPDYLRELAVRATPIDVAEGQLPEMALIVP